MAAQPLLARPGYLSLRIKLLSGFTLLFSLLFGAVCYWSYSFADRQALEQIHEQLLATAHGAAAGIDGDLVLSLAREGHRNAQGTSDDPRYAKLMDWLAAVQAIEPQAWPYIYVRGSAPDQIVYVADLWARSNRAKAVAFGHQTADPLLYRGLREWYVVSDDRGRPQVTSDEWGSWVTAVAPITTTGGQAVAAVGVDFEADYVSMVRQQLLHDMAVGFVIAYGVLFIMIFFATSAVVQPLERLTARARRIGAGEYDPDEPQQARRIFLDEIDVLAASFASMAEKVNEREQRLRQQVQVLTIEIDAAKRQQQVDAIVESDFFRDLQGKAQQIRTRRWGGGQMPFADSDGHDKP